MEVVAAAAAAIPLVEAVAVKISSVLVNGVEKYYDERISQRQTVHTRCMQQYQPFRRYVESGSTPVQDLSQLAFVSAGLVLAQETYTADEQSRIDSKLSLEGAAGVKARSPPNLEQPAVYMVNGADFVLIVTCEQVPAYHQRLYKHSTFALPDVLPSVFMLKTCGYDHLNNLHVCYTQVTRQPTPVNLLVSVLDSHLMVSQVF